jgi:hypothetical protein
MGIVLTATVVVLSMLGGILTNWFTRPPEVTTGRLVIMVGVVVLAVVVATVWKESYDEAGASSAESNTSVSTSTAQRASSRHLQSWVSDVNDVCAPVVSKLESVRSEYDWNDSLSDKENIANMRRLLKILGPLVRDLNSVELPSGANEERRANNWLQAYDEFYSAFVAVIGKLEKGTSGGLLGEVIGLPGANSAFNEYLDAQAAAKGRGDALGIECPASNVAK